MPRNKRVPYTLGQFKDDQVQDHKHDQTADTSPGGSAIWMLYLQRDRGLYGIGGVGTYTQGVAYARTGTTTHGKQKGVNFIIKA